MQRRSLPWLGCGRTLDARGRGVRPRVFSDRSRARGGVLYARLYAQRRLVFSSCAGALIVGLLAPSGPGGAAAFLLAASASRLALAQKPGAQSPPRSLRAGRAALRARARARKGARAVRRRRPRRFSSMQSPKSLRGARDAALTFVVALAAVVTATLIALSATMRRGASRASYVRTRRSGERGRLRTGRRRALACSANWHSARSSPFSPCASTARRSRATIRSERVRRSRASPASRD